MPEKVSPSLLGLKEFTADGKTLTEALID